VTCHTVWLPSYSEYQAFMKGFDYAKKVFCRVPPAQLLRWFVPEVRQLLRGAYELGVSAAALHNWV
jgi:hypothetical protein